MAHLCMFGGHEGELGSDHGPFITVFGGTELRRPPAARIIIDLGRSEQPNFVSYGFFTLFGGASIVWPSLAAEFLALTDAVGSGGLTLEEWDRRVGKDGAQGPIRVNAITLFAGFEGDELPSEEIEIEEIGLQKHLGRIPDEASEILMLAIGQRGVVRLSAVRQAVSVALQGRRGE